MNTVTDNFKQVSDSILQFDRVGEFYMVLVLKRRKDTNGKMKEGVNEDNRLIKHYFVYDKEYLERKMESIKALCEQNNARAYILPQRRDCRLVLWALHDKVSETLKDGAMNVHFDHLIRSCVAGMHETVEKWHKRWVIDIDYDDSVFKNHINEWLNWLGDEASLIDKDNLCNEYVHWLYFKLNSALVTRDISGVDYMPSMSHVYKPEDVNIITTPHGAHIVTPPFNRDEKAMKQYFGSGKPLSEWIKPDAMTLIYSPLV